MSDSDFCQYCGRTEKNYTLNNDRTYVCGTCIQTLLRLDDKEILDLHEATEDPRQKGALKRFMKTKRVQRKINELQNG